MPHYAIGDVQGCLPELEQLLEEIRFDPADDQLWFVGDLVARGGQSLDVLRLIYGLRKRVKVVLGNHDLHLLAEWHRPPKKRRANGEFKRIFKAHDGRRLLKWLQKRPLYHENRDLGFAMVHAGLAPGWSLKQTRRLAREVARCLRSEQAPLFFQNMYGNKPRGWRNHLRGWIVCASLRTT